MNAGEYDLLRRMIGDADEELSDQRVIEQIALPLRISTFRLLGKLFPGARLESVRVGYRPEEEIVEPEPDPLFGTARSKPTVYLSRMVVQVHEGGKKCEFTYIIRDGSVHARNEGVSLESLRVGHPQREAAINIVFSFIHRDVMATYEIMSPT